ncbi:class I SAM-dependent methyltransferase [Patescibacteria group bacterium AH-259-L05]|nr:class I SAM-dependent methyltransferase [Patescibacteria group bacterium AH-259-L05]
MQYYENIIQCRICGSYALTEVLSLGEQFISQGFVESNKDSKLSKTKVPLTLVLCDKSKNPQGCGLLQLKETTHPDNLYRNYFYRSGTNATMRADLSDVVDDVMQRVGVSRGDYVVDIGSSDGTMISYFPSYLRRIGVEPAKNIAWDHLDPSIQMVNDYFSKNALRQVVGDRPVKIFTSCAMFYDLDDPHTFVAEVKSMLAPKGIWCIQLSYLALMLKNMNFYDICHEHLEYYSLATLNYLMQRHNLTIFDAATNAVNGGSLRVFITHSENKKIQTSNIKKLLKEETKMKLFDAQTYKSFHNKIIDLADCVKEYILNEIKKGGLVIGLGASTKGNVLLQFFGINNKILPYISDINPEKISLRTLGTDIKIISDEQASKLSPMCKLVLPWYFKDEIVKREKEYISQGGKLLFPMPYPHLITKEGESLLKI